MQAEPVVGLRVLAEADDELIGLLGHLAGLGEHVALRLGDGEDPVLALVVVDADLEAAVEEARGDLLGWEVADSVEREVDPEWRKAYLTNFFSSR